MLQHSGSHLTFLDFDITVSNCKESTKLYRKRDDFSLFIARMPNFHSNIPLSTLYENAMSEKLRCRSTFL